MKTKLLSVSLAIIMAIALCVPAFAAEGKTVKFTYVADWSNEITLEITNVTSQTEKDLELPAFSGNIREFPQTNVISCNAPATFTLIPNAGETNAVVYGGIWLKWDSVAANPVSFKWNGYKSLEDYCDADLSQRIDNVDGAKIDDGTYYIADGSSFTINNEGTYLVYIMVEIMEPIPFFVEVSGNAATAAASAPAAGSSAKLKTTEGLSKAIPPSPVFETKNVTYTVAKGDDIASIAKKFGVKANDIKALNKDYFDGLADRNKKNNTNVNLEVGVTLTVKAISEPKDLSYTVQKGDTLSVIAFNYYGASDTATLNKIKTANKAYFDDLAARNKKNKTNVALEAGAVLTLPGSGLQAPVTQGSLSNAAGIYVVKSGDTLADIAKKYYGDSKEWKKIYEANKDKVKLYSTNSPMIYVGQWLVIPE